MNQAYARQAAAMYQQYSARAGVEDADAHQLVSMLLDGAIDRMAQACGHIRHGDVVGKGNSISRTVAIIGQLRMSLDHEAGGALADRLEALYEYVTRRLIHAQLHDDVAALEECIRLLSPVREGWKGIRGEYLAGRAVGS